MDELFELRVVDPARGVRALRFEHAGQGGLLSADASGQHRASADEDGRQVQACRSHEQSGNVLVAVRDHDEAVKSVRHDHRLCGVRDKVAGNE